MDQRKHWVCGRRGRYNFWGFLKSGESSPVWECIYGKALEGVGDKSKQPKQQWVSLDLKQYYEGCFPTLLSHSYWSLGKAALIFKRQSMGKQDLLKIQIYFIARFTEMYLFYKDKKKIPAS